MKQPLIPQWNSMLIHLMWITYMMSILFLAWKDLSVGKCACHHVWQPEFAYGYYMEKLNTEYLSIIPILQCWDGRCKQWIPQKFLDNLPWSTQVNWNKRSSSWKQSGWEKWLPCVVIWPPLVLHDTLACSHSREHMYKLRHMGTHKKRHTKELFCSQNLFIYF